MLVSYSSGQSKIRLGSWHNCTRYPNLLIRSNKQSNAETSSKLPEMSMQACFPKQGLALLQEEAFATSPSPAFQYSLLLLCWRWRFPRVRNSKCILATWTSPAHPCYILHIWTQSPHRSQWLDTWLAPRSELLDRRIGNIRLRAFGLPRWALGCKKQGAKGSKPSLGYISRYERWYQRIWKRPQNLEQVNNAWTQYVHAQIRTDTHTQVRKHTPVRLVPWV